MNLKIKRKVRKMSNVLIGYKQGDNNYVFVSNIGKRSISVTTVMEEAIEFNKKALADNVCNFLNDKDQAHNYVALEIEIRINE